MGITMEPVSKYRRQVKRIYFDSFPKKDRMPYWMLLLMAKMNHTEFRAFCDQGRVCGFSYFAAVGKITFIMFLAVDSKLRSKGCGSLMIKEIKSLYPESQVIVSIERCDKTVENLEQRLRRKRFYEKNGFLSTGCLLELSKEQQEVLVKNGEFDPQEFSEFFKKYSNGTMNPPIIPIGHEGDLR